MGAEQDAAAPNWDASGTEQGAPVTDLVEFEAVAGVGAHDVSERKGGAEPETVLVQRSESAGHIRRAVQNETITYDRKRVEGFK